MEKLISNHKDQVENYKKNISEKDEKIEILMA